MPQGGRCAGGRSAGIIHASQEGWIFGRLNFRNGPDLLRHVGENGRANSTTAPSILERARYLGGYRLRRTNLDEKPVLVLPITPALSSSSSALLLRYLVLLLLLYFIGF